MTVTTFRLHRGAAMNTRKNTKPRTFPVTSGWLNPLALARARELCPDRKRWQIDTSTQTVLVLNFPGQKFTASARRRRTS